MLQRIVWIDSLRGFCMLAILWLHTEMYYAGTDVTPYHYYVGDVLATFFFISGYLFFSPHKTLSVRHKLWGVLRWLVIPYFVFTIIISALKAVFLPPSDVGELAMGIITGHASWFVSALIVAEILLTIILHYFQKRPLVIAFVAVLALIASALIGNRMSSWCYEQDLWQVNEALLGLFLMILGYYFHRYEDLLLRWLEHPVVLPLVFIVYVGLKVVISLTESSMIFGPIIVSDYFLFVADILVSTLFFVLLFMRLPKMQFMEWVGRHSIVYYFFAGAVPLVVGKGLGAVGIVYTNFLHIFIAFTLVCFISSAIVWLIYRFTSIVR